MIVPEPSTESTKIKSSTHTRVAADLPNEMVSELRLLADSNERSVAAEVRVAVKERLEREAA